MFSAGWTACERAGVGEGMGFGVGEETAEAGAAAVSEVEEGRCHCDWLRKDKVVYVKREVGCLE